MTTAAPTTDDTTLTGPGDPLYDGACALARMIDAHASDDDSERVTLFFSGFLFGLTGALSLQNGRSAEEVMDHVAARLTAVMALDDDEDE